MSTKDYVAIANILAGDYACANAHGKQVLLCTTLSLADYFAKENPNFRRDRFYAAVFGESNPALTNMPAFQLGQDR